MEIGHVPTPAQLGVRVPKKRILCVMALTAIALLGVAIAGGGGHLGAHSYLIGQVSMLSSIVFGGGILPVAIACDEWQRKLAGLEFFGK